MIGIKESIEICLGKARVGFILMVALLIAHSPAFSHGGKNHGSHEFNALYALQKATKLYHRLIGSGKLAEGWERDLVKVEIFTKVRRGQKEFVVSFHRSTGEPRKVYIFFDEAGKYAGSNFTGK